MSTPVLPDWFPRRELQRPTAEQLERVDNRKRTLTYAGPNEVIPIVYGEQLVGGPIIAGPAQPGTSTVYAVALCWAGAEGVERIEDCRVGESIVNFGAISDPNAGVQVNNSGITVRVFDGRQTQPYSTLVSAIPGFDDAFHGIAYAIITFTTENFTSLPQVTFRIKGRKCHAFSSPSWSPLALPFEPNDIVQHPVHSNLVIVGDSGQLLRGSSLGNLVSTNPGFGTSNIYKVGVSGNTSANARFFVVGQHGKVSKTPSNNTGLWTLSTDDLGSGDLYAASASTYDTGIVGGEGGVVATSGSTTTDWVARDVGFGSSAVLCAAAVSGRVFVAGADGKVASATNTTGTWTHWDSKFGSASIRCAVTSLDYSEISDSNRLILLGDDGKVSWSADAETFTLVDAGFGGANITHAVRTDRGIFALSDDGQIRETQDGEHWQAARLAHSNFRKLFYAAGLLIAVDIDGDAFTVDPADISNIQWTENPVLHMYDFVTNNEFGMGANLIGAEASAAVADSLYSGLPRSRTGLTIQDSMTEEDALALFAQYAEVLWSYDGRDVVIIPDAPVDTVHQIEPSTIIGDSLSLSTVGLDQIPTQIRLMFSDREEPTWAPRPAVAEAPEHTMHGMPTSPSSVPLPGVFNRLEAERRAWQRLMRLQAPGRLEWQMTAPGMPHQAGDVVRLPNVRGLQSVDVRLTAQPTMIAPLKYQMAGEIYSASHYPEGGEGIAAPEGAILILRGSGAIPDGWQAFNMGGRLVREGAPGNAGSLTNVTTSVSIQPAGAHQGIRMGASMGYTTPRYPNDLVSYGSPIDPGGMAPDHNHSVAPISVPAVNGLTRQQLRWVKRVDGPSLLPAGIAFLSDRHTSSTEVAASLDVTGAYLAGGVSESRQNRLTASTETSYDGAHVHGHPTYFDITDGKPPAKTLTFFREAGEHNHSVSATINTKLRSIALAVFESLGDATIPAGGIVGWESGAIPEGWALCDGSNGTVDLRDRFIYLTAPASAGVEHESESQVSVTIGSSTSGGGAHGHSYTRTVISNYLGDGALTFHGGGTNYHSHTVNGPLVRTFDASNIQRYQLRFIQHIGE